MELTPRSETDLDPVEALIHEFSRLPGVGNKTAARLTYHILNGRTELARSLSDALIDAATRINLCETCFNFTDLKICRICRSSSRTKDSICIIESPSDILSIENSHAYNGNYHVLHGVISPLDGKGPEDLKITELLDRLQKNSEIEEVIIALNPSVEGEATSLFLNQLIKPLNVRTTRLAYGLPAGGHLEFSDQLTVKQALDNRREWQS